VRVPSPASGHDIALLPEEFAMHAEASGGEGEMSLRVEGDSPHRRLRFVAERIALVVFEIHLAPQLAFRPKARFSLRVRIDVLSAHSLAIDVDSDKVRVIDRDKCRNGPRRAIAKERRQCQHVWHDPLLDPHPRLPGSLDDASAGGED
jgi:hypothetical protein